MKSSPNVSVFGPFLSLTITIEPREDDGEFPAVHLHPGGQGFWVARMLTHLGERPVLVSPVGGETGGVLRSLLPSWGVALRTVETEADSPAYVHDRRSGDRQEVAASQPTRFDRHELDDLYGLVLEAGIETGLTVMTGKTRGDFFPLEAFGRLGSDLAAADVSVIGDLHGAELEAFLDGGPIRTLKTSDEDLIADGLLSPRAARRSRVTALGKLHALGAEDVVISADDGPTFALLGGEVWSASPPLLKPADHRGSGDSMTAGLVAAAVRGLSPEDTLRLACAAGAANATRHGLGNVRSELVSALVDKVEVCRS